MQYLNVIGAVLLAGAALSGPAAAQDITRDEAATVMANCQRQRESIIAPLREEAVDRCVTVEGLDQRDCERRNRDFGERNSGGNPDGIGWNLATCQRAEGAEKHFSENPDSDRYAY